MIITKDKNMSKERLPLNTGINNLEFQRIYNEFTKQYSDNIFKNVNVYFTELKRTFQVKLYIPDCNSIYTVDYLKLYISNNVSCICSNYYNWCINDNSVVQDQYTWNLYCNRLKFFLGILLNPLENLFIYNKGLYIYLPEEQIFTGFTNYVYEAIRIIPRVNYIGEGMLSKDFFKVLYGLVASFERNQAIINNIVFKKINNKIFYYNELSEQYNKREAVLSKKITKKITHTNLTAFIYDMSDRKLFREYIKTVGYGNELPQIMNIFYVCKDYSFMYNNNIMIYDYDKVGFVPSPLSRIVYYEYTHIFVYIYNNLHKAFNNVALTKKFSKYIYNLISDSIDKRNSNQYNLENDLHIYINTKNYMYSYNEDSKEHEICNYKDVYKPLLLDLPIAELSANLNKSEKIEEILKLLSGGNRKPLYFLAKIIRNYISNKSNDKNGYMLYNCTTELFCIYKSLFRRMKVNKILEVKDTSELSSEDYVINILCAKINKIGPIFVDNVAVKRYPSKINRLRKLLSGAKVSYANKHNKISNSIVNCTVTVNNNIPIIFYAKSADEVNYLVSNFDKYMYRLNCSNIIITNNELEKCEKLIQSLSDENITFLLLELPKILEKDSIFFDDDYNKLDIKISNEVEVNHNLDREIVESYDEMVKAFISQCCYKHKKREVYSADLFAAFIEFAYNKYNTKIPSNNKTVFSRTVSALTGIKPRKTNHKRNDGRRAFAGLGLKKNS